MRRVSSSPKKKKEKKKPLPHPPSPSSPSSSSCPFSSLSSIHHHHQHHYPTSFNPSQIPNFSPLTDQSKTIEASSMATEPAKSKTVETRTLRPRFLLYPQ